jgi:hypothetical protein
VRFAEKPNSPECGKRQELPERSTGGGLIKLDLSRLLLGKMAHHAKQLRFVLEGGVPDQ